MKIRLTAFAVAVAFSTSALAQIDEEFMNSDAMEVQRCIWRCLAEFGAASKRYPQCIDSRSAMVNRPRKQSTSRKPRKAKTKSTKRRVIRNWRGDVLIRRVN